MAKVTYMICLVSSIILNLLFIINLNVGDRGNLSWSTRAAAEAEAVAAVSCSGHGRAYLDGSVVDGDEPVCECNSCYIGPHCSEFLPGCAANADVGDPLFLEPFWVQHAASSAVLVAGWQRMSYTYDDLTFVSQELERQIRLLHKLVGNAITDNRFIVFGVGSTQVISAAVHALSPENASSPANVVVSIPYFPLYKQQIEFLESVDYKFQGEASLWKNSSDARTNSIEIVTSPNNPDGQLNKAVLDGPNAKAIYDRAYYWPHFTPILAPADEDLMIFTLSKLTGHAGSRFGWAVIKEQKVYEKMIMYMSVNTMGVSRETQLRALKLLKVVIGGDKREIFQFGYKTMKARWERLNRTLSLSGRFSLQKVAPQSCTFFQKIREASPAFAWVKCEREEDKDCGAVLKAAKIIGRQGSAFGAEDRYVRLSLVRRQDDFDLLIDHLTKLVSDEDGAKTM